MQRVAYRHPWPAAGPVSLSGDGSVSAVLAVQGFPIIAELAQPELRLACASTRALTAPAA